MATAAHSLESTVSSLWVWTVREVGHRRARSEVAASRANTDRVVAKMAAVHADFERAREGVDAAIVRVEQAVSTLGQTSQDLQQDDGSGVGPLAAPAHV